MNRALVVPAGCCLVAFVVLLASFQGAAGQQKLPVASGSASVAEKATRASSVSDVEAEVMLTALAEDYMRPWRQWETSPQRLLSRAAPRPIPSISSEIILVDGSKGRSENYLLATISVKTGARTQPVPCVVDRSTKLAWLNVEGKWMAQEDWLKSAPQP